MTSHPQYPQAPRPGQPWPPAQPPQPVALRPPHARRKRRVFLWVFLAVQALFLFWVISGSVSGHSAAVHCHDQFLTHQQCQNAADTGTAIGAALVIVFWMVVDVILGVSYGVYKLATRSR